MAYDNETLSYVFSCNIPLMKKRCNPLLKHVDSGIFIFWEGYDHPHLSKYPIAHVGVGKDTKLFPLDICLDTYNNSTGTLGTIT